MLTIDIVVGLSIDSSSRPYPIDRAWEFFSNVSSVSDLARSMSVSNLTASERIELSQLASRIHRRLAQQRGVYPEPAALQTARWLTTRAYMALSLEESELDFTEAEPSTPSSR